MITFESVDLAYEGQRIFEGLSLEIPKGGKTVITGRSGRGKSSLFHLILGFTAPQAGRITVDGRRVGPETVWKIRQGIAFVDQGVSIGPGTAVDWVRSIFALKANAGRGFRQDEMDRLWRYFELGDEERTKDLADLSGGERQRVALIGAVLLGRKTFLFDEVTSALDRRLKGKVVDLFLREPEWTVVAISHDSVWINDSRTRVFDLEEGAWKR